jgi:hypothetical protein
MLRVIRALRQIQCERATLRALPAEKLDTANLRRPIDAREELARLREEHSPERNSLDPKIRLSKSRTKRRYGTYLANGG